jgi:hypothetical protein
MRWVRKCSTYGEEERWEEPGIDGGILKWVFKKWGGGHSMDSCGS